tara:strand:- start:222 stop:506 length:285 start_codon:yes stop_codon:yes gene_type:complete
MARNLLDVEYDPDGGLLYVPRRDTSRTVVTSCRDALNGYQKGKCFYCFIDISIKPGNDDLADVDHFLPHILLEQKLADIETDYNKNDPFQDRSI